MKKRVFKLWLFSAVIVWQGCSEHRLTEESLLPGLPKKVETSTDIEKISNPHWAWVEDFPGIVPDSVPRLGEVDVKIIPDYKTWNELKIKNVDNPWYSTGLYIAPSEVITVNVPEGLEMDVKYRIGSTHCNLNPEKELKRYPRIFESGTLVAGENKIFNHFGGHLYFLFSSPSDIEVTLKVKGAVKSPDFILGETNPQEWLETIKTSQVPWGELRCDRIILTLPLDKLQKVVDPQELMEFYQELIIKDYNEWNGLSDDAEDIKHRSPQEPCRITVDKQICAGSGHAGYPIMGGLSWGDKAVDMERLLTNEWGIYHEIGHNYQTWIWKWSTLGEVSCNFNVFHLRNRYGEWPVNNIDQFQGYVGSWVLENTDPNKDFDDSNADGLDHTGRIVPFIQLAQEYGWKFYDFLSTSARNMDPYDHPQNNDERRYFFIRRACEYANANLKPFFDAWGIKYDNAVEAYIDQYPEIAPEDYFWTKFDMEKFPDLDAERAPVIKDQPDVSEVKLLDSRLWSLLAVSSWNTDGTGGEPEFLWDNNNSTCWVTKPANGGFPYPHWVEIDLGNTYSVCGVKMMQRNFGYDMVKPKDFTIEVKNAEGDEWTLVLQSSLEAQHTSIQDFIFDTTNARYLRFTTQNPQSSTTGGMCLAELKVQAMTSTSK